MTIQPNKYALIFIFSLFPFFGNSQFTVNNDATQDDCNCYTLTPDEEAKSGSVWNNNKISLTNSFDYTFKVYLGTHDGSGADGIAFVLQPLSTSVGSVGGGLGFSGITPSIGVTIDTYENSNSSDPSYDHIAIQKNGDINHSSSNNLAGPVQALANSSNIEDGQFHTLRVVWDATTHLLSTYMDGVLRLSITIDLTNDIFSGDPMVYWGFTGSTGGATNLQRFCTQNLASFNIDNTLSNLCGANATVTFEDGSSSFGNITNWNWNFGDGSNSTEQNPTHTYSSPGTYTVQLTVTGNDGCLSDVEEIEITIQPVDTIHQMIALCNNSTFTLPDNQIVSEPGEYTYTLTSAVTSCDSIVIFHISDANSNYDPILDKNICKGESVELEAIADALSYTWNPSNSLNNSAIQNPIASPEETTTYTVSAQIVIGSNLVTNGDFEQGNTGFWSAYNYSTSNSLGGPGHYTVASGISNGWWANCSDHTSTTNPSGGNMIITDGANGTNGIPAQSSLWCQTISVVPNTDYAFSTWLTNSNLDNATSDIGFFINEIQVGTTQSTPAVPCEWNQFYVVWNSGNNTTIDICIKEMSGAQPGNDFAIDDIAFYQLCTITQTVTVNVSDVQLTIDQVEDSKCFESNNGHASYHASNGIGNYTFNYQSATTSPTQTTETTIENLSKGNYSITVKDEIGCEASSQFTINEPTAITSVTHTLKDIECADGNTGSAEITISGGTPNYQVVWQNGETSQTAVQLGGGSNLVTITDANGCIQIDSAFVNELFTDLQFPNVINMESVVGNNRFDFEVFATNFNACYSYTLDIINRWGIIVFTVENDKNNPDLNCTDCFKGLSNNGTPLTPGTYFYHLKTDRDLVKSGFFTLIGK